MTNDVTRPFRWTGTADEILARVSRFCSELLIRDTRIAPMPHLRTGLVVAGIAAALVIGGVPSRGQSPACPGGRLLLLTNGRIHTMDAKRTVVSKVRIANGRFVEVGDGASASGGCTDTIDLRGRTVIPGMIDNHFHVQLVGSRPGYETRTIETAFSIAEAQAVIRERAKGVPEGAFITAIGGLQPRQFAENRLPTLAELDAAAPRHPVYIHVAFNGPAVDQLAGQALLREQGHRACPAPASSSRTDRRGTRSTRCGRTGRWPTPSGRCSRCSATSTASG